MSLLNRNSRLGDIGAELPIFALEEITVLHTLVEWSGQPTRIDDLELIGHQELAKRAQLTTAETLGALSSLRRHYLVFRSHRNWRLTKLGRWIWENRLDTGAKP